MRNIGILDSAEPLFQRVLDARGRVFGSEHPKTLWTVVGFAKLREKQGRWDAAEVFFRRAKEGYEKAFGDEHAEATQAAKDVSDFLERRKEAEARA